MNTQGEKRKTLGNDYLGDEPIASARKWRV